MSIWCYVDAGGWTSGPGYGEAAMGLTVFAPRCQRKRLTSRW
jgi:hypothetical protein